MTNWNKFEPLRMTRKEYEKGIKEAIHWISCLVMGGEYEEAQEQQAHLEWFKANTIIID